MKYKKTPLITNLILASIICFVLISCSQNINFITYLEVKRFDRKEINFYIRQCLNELNEIAEYNKQTMLLTSKYKIIKEDANLIVDLKQ